MHLLTGKIFMFPCDVFREPVGPSIEDDHRVVSYLVVVIFLWCMLTAVEKNVFFSEAINH